MKQKITKDMTLGEVVSKYPSTIDVFIKYGLPCAGCHVAGYETIEEGAKAHGFGDKETKKLLDDLNKVAEEKEDVAFDEKELDEFSIYDDESSGNRSTQKGKTRFTPYKKGGGYRTRK